MKRETQPQDINFPCYGALTPVGEFILRRKIDRAILNEADAVLDHVISEETKSFAAKKSRRNGAALAQHDPWLNRQNHRMGFKVQL